jgi:hypothetical protein
MISRMFFGLISAGVLVAAITGATSSATAQELMCSQLLAECGDGPGRWEKEGVETRYIGSGVISTQCTGIVSGVLASYRFCHGDLTWAGAAAVLIHSVHSDPKLMKMTGWDCARLAFAQTFPCQQ